MVAGTASATHFRYGTLSWEPTENANEVLFTGGQAWRASAFGSPSVGQVVGGEGCIQMGDGVCEPFWLLVNSRSTVNDYFSGTFVRSDGTNGILHTYPAANNNGAPWAVSWGSCCRISAHSSGNFHVNNPDASEQLLTSVDLAPPSNAAPRSTLPPINACPREAFCTIPIPSADRDDDALTFRLSSASEAGGISQPFSSTPAEVHPTTGLYTWDTHGAIVGGASEHTLYSTQVMIGDGRTETPLDFFIEILPDGVSPPYWVMPPTPCGETLFASADSELTFDVRAQSDDPIRVVSVSHLGLPAGATFPTVTAGNPASGVFTWIPTQMQAGNWLVVFAAEDDLGYPAPACPVNIHVNIHPPPTFTVPVTCVGAAPLLGTEGFPLSFPLVANTSNLTRTVTITLASGPAGLGLASSFAGNPASATATWPSPVAGHWSALFRATDDFGIKASCVVPIDVSGPPVADAGPDTCALLGADVVFDGTASAMPFGIGSIASYVWTFPNGTTASGALVTRRLGDLSEVGTFATTLTVTSADGLVGTDTVDITLVDTFDAAVAMTQADYTPFQRPAGLASAAGCARPAQGAAVQLSVVYTTGDAALDAQLADLLGEPGRPILVWEGAGVLNATGELAFQVPFSVAERFGLPLGLADPLSTFLVLQGHYEVRAHMSMNGGAHGDADTTFRVILDPQFPFDEPPALVISTGRDEE
ncbi:MAG TPA: PKD domain-containing protein [Candidatus Thermoplasmatota archaeon]|nr:PKD domain-containing protein [Candidatus Thermoplasmatota archaeon]